MSRGGGRVGIAADLASRLPRGDDRADQGVGEDEEGDDLDRNIGPDPFKIILRAFLPSDGAGTAALLRVNKPLRECFG